MNEEEPTVLKVILIGESAVGKTSILSRYSKNTFSSILMATSVPFFAKKEVEIDNKNFCLEIWDTAGQEKYRALTKMFFQSAIVVIFVYDITNRNSFEELKKYWMKEVKEQCDNNMIFCLAANKNDMYEMEEVSNKEGFNLANSINALFFQVSAKTGSGVEEMFNGIVKKYLDPSFKTEEVIEKKVKRLKNKKGSAITKHSHKRKSKKKKCWAF